MWLCLDRARFGSVETEVIVRRQLSLIPSAPRFVRVGDIFEAGVIVTVSGGTVSGVPVTVDLAIVEDSKDLIFLETDAKTVMETDADGQMEIRFGLRALKLGDANFVIRAGDSSTSVLATCASSRLQN